MHRKRYGIQGFTLVEMAVVMVIVGLLIGLGSAMIGPMMNLSKSRDTREFIGSAVESINSWAASNNRLPDVGAGVTGFRGVAKTTTDAWARDLVYLYDSNLAPGIATKDTICGRRTSSIIISNPSITPIQTINNVAFAVISQGEDAQLQTNASDGPIIGSRPVATGAVTTITIDANNRDIVRWVTLDELRSKIGCQGAQLKILNNEVPAGSSSSNYSAIISADGGVSFAAPNLYRWCIQATVGSPVAANIVFMRPDVAGAPVAIPNVANLYQANCLSYAEGNWPQAGMLMVSWTPLLSPATNSYSFTVFVRDNNDADAVAPDNDNISSKSFVLTVNP